MQANLALRSTRPRPDVTVVEAAGEIDTATVAQLRERLDGAGTRHVAVDLAEVTFVDSSGTEMLVRTGRQPPGTLHLLGVGRSRAVTRVLDLFGLTAEFSQFDDVGALLAGVDPG